MSSVKAPVVAKSESSTKFEQRPVIILGGGVGPLAGVMLHEAIIGYTSGVRKDQHHFDIWHISASSDLPDRTQFLLGEVKVNPAAMMANNIADVARLLAQRRRKWIAAVPCATFHSPLIFNEFLRIVSGIKGNVGVVNLVAETVAHIADLPGAPVRVGVLSTLGSYRFGVWRNPLAAAGLEVVELPEGYAEELQRAIYDGDYGLKAVNPPTRRAEEAVLGAIRYLCNADVEVLILGCTELPLLNDRIQEEFSGEVILCDPVRIQARRLVAMAAARAQMESLEI